MIKEQHNLQNKLRGGIRAGFSLVEVTLAMMVIAVGILAVMSLFPAGLDQNMRSIEDTRMAFFAEEVFNGLQAHAAEDWDGLETIIMKLAAEESWGSAPLPPEVISDWNTVTTNIYYSKYEGANDVDNIEHHVLRYKLLIQDEKPRIKSATLWVWPGKFGPTDTPNVFYSEFFRLETP
ncbi:MAG: prepilin-type N-terminal cleavage/methylation domain-containing protein [Lentisphaerae bacterium]|nr:prepilin-type N-terminal cleavage/methylation domain-containing protein [Lentisphaerota bacterium]